MPHPAKREGSGFEREVVTALTVAGIQAWRVPLGGAAGGSHIGDVDLVVRGGKRKLECKRQHGDFKTLYQWLGANYALVIRHDRCQPLVVMQLSDFAALIRRISLLSANTHRTFMFLAAAGRYISGIMQALLSRAAQSGRSSHPQQLKIVFLGGDVSGEGHMSISSINSKLALLALSAMLAIFFTTFSASAKCKLPSIWRFHAVHGGDTTGVTVVSCQILVNNSGGVTTDTGLTNAGCKAHWQNGSIHNMTMYPPPQGPTGDPSVLQIDSTCHLTGILHPMPLDFDIPIHGYMRDNAASAVGTPNGKAPWNFNFIKVK